MTSSATQRIWANYLPIDVDCEHLEDALDVTRQLADLFCNKWRVSQGAFNIYFSGAKGFHLMIQSVLFGDLQPSDDLHLVFARVREGMAEEAGIGKTGIDWSVKDKMRLLRLPNSQHGKSNLYKIQLRFDEMNRLAVSEIKAKAREPGMLWNTDRTGLMPQKPVVPNKYAVELYQNAVEHIERTRLRPSSNDLSQLAEHKQRSGKLFCKARQKMWYSQIPQGSRNNCCIRLVSELRLGGMTDSQALELISFWNHNNDIGLPAEELSGIVRTVYASKRPYDYGCRDEIIESFCPFGDKSKCQRYGEYKRQKSKRIMPVV
jgi:hypothetical protein